ncbi:MAG: hypothetical protein IJY25_00605 [Bacilli bacterium]|nr:hypothetical protein [Bacilli bacterium]
MEKKKRPTFPKGFFTKSRPTITTKEALKDVIPFEWSKNVLNGKSKVKIVSLDKKN